MAFPAIKPLYVYTDIDGSPLNDGFLYFGEANTDPEANPITVYWDAAQTQPATQPIRTIGGYPVNSGVRSIVYAPTDYSVNIRNKNGTLVYTSASEVNDNPFVFLQSGTGAVANTVQIELKKRVCVDQYGTTMADWQKAYDYVNTLGGGVVVWPARTAVYAFSSSGITVYGNTETVIEDGAVIDMSGMSTGTRAFSALGSEGSEYSLIANSAEGVQTVTISSANLIASGIVANDWVRVSSDKLFDPLRTSSKSGELAQVESVDTGTGVITLWLPLCDTYNTADAATVSKITLIDGVKFSGGGLFTDSRSPTSNRAAIRCRFCFNPSVNDLRFERIAYSGAWFQDCVQPSGANLYFDDFWSASTGYGVNCTDATQDGLFTGIYGNRVRHLFTTTNSSGVKGIPRRITVNGFVTVNSATASGGSGGDAMDTHAACEDIHFANGIIRGASNLGINFEGRSGSISNVFIYDSDNSGVAISNFTSKSGRMAIDNVHVFRPNGVGIRVDTNGVAYESLSISNCSSTDPASYALFIEGEVGLEVEKLAISNFQSERAANANGSIWIQNTNDFAVANVIIKDPSGTGGASLRLRDCKNGSVSNIVGNHATNATGSHVYVNATGAGLSKDITLDGINVEPGTYSSLRGILIDNNAQNVRIGTNDLKAATTPISFGTGSGHVTDEIVLASVNTAVSCDATTNENTLATVTIPAKLMGVTGAVRVTTLWTMTNSGNTKTLRVKFGGVEYLTGSLTTAASAQTQTIIRNRTATTQVGYVAGTLSTFGSNAGAVVTSSIDTNSDVTLLVTGQKATAGETLTLEAVTVEILPR